MFRSKRYSGFDPRTLGDCAMWFDAADRNSLTLSGSNVTQWTNKAGSPNATTPSGTVTVSPLPQNGVSPVRFANSSYLTLSNFVYSTNTPTFFYVIRGIVSTVSGAGYFLLDSASTNYVVSSVYTSLGGQGFVAVVATLTAENQFNYSPNTLFLSNTKMVSVSKTAAYIDGSPLSLTSNGNPGGLTGTVTLTLGSSRSDARSYDLCEFIVYSSSVTDSQRQQVEGYLAWKWGISSSFQPTSISGLSLWLDAADSTTLTLSGSNVTQWRDKSSNAYQSTVAGSPVYTRNSRLNQIGCVSFNGTSDSLLWNSFSLNQPFTAFAVCTLRISANPLYAFVLEPTLSSNAVILYTSSGPVLTMWAGLQNQTTSPTVTFSSNITGVYSAIFNGTSSLLGFNGTATSNLSPGTSNWTGLYLGRDWGGIYQPGEYGEVIFYSGALSTAQRQQVEGYLATKWGLQGSLPASHPYKNTPLL